MTTPQPFDTSEQTFHIGAGDLEPSLLMTLYWTDGSLVSELADATAVTFSLWASPRAGNPIIDHAVANIVDAAHGIVKYVWADGDTDEPGTYYGRIFVEFDGRDASWPDDGYVVVVISAAGAAADTPPPDDVAQGLIQPSGEVQGTWQNMTIRTIHSGSSHQQVAAVAADALNAHRDAGVDQHDVYARADGGRGMFATAINFDDEQFTGSDQERFDAVLAYASGIGGGRIVVPPGTYDATIVPVSDVEIEGAGVGVTIIRLPDDAADGDRVVNAAAATAVDGFAMSHLTIDGNKTVWGQNNNIDTGCVDLSADPGNLTNLRLTDVEVVNGQSVGVLIADASGSRLDGVTAHDNGWTSGTGTNIDAVGIHVQSTDVTLHGCRSYTNASHGFLFDGTVTLPTAVLCEAHANGGDGFHVGGATAMARFAGCVSRQNTGAGFDVIGATFPKIDGTIVESNGLGGVVFDGVTAGGVTGSLVKANDTTASGADEILLTGTTTGCTVTGNVIAASASQHAINEATSADTGNEISGNRLTAGAAGLVHLFSAASLSGSGSPAGVVAAGVGSTWRRTNGGANTSFYVKESGGGATTGWAAK